MRKIHGKLIHITALALALLLGFTGGGLAASAKASTVTAAATSAASTTATSKSVQPTNYFTATLKSFLSVPEET